VLAGGDEIDDRFELRPVGDVLHEVLTVEQVRAVVRVDQQRRVRRPRAQQRALADLWHSREEHARRERRDLQRFPRLRDRR
jgi:hypothetical protein